MAMTLGRQIELGTNVGTNGAKVSLDLGSLLFATPEQKLVKFLADHASDTFAIRALASRLKGVRGIGGIEGITRILRPLALMGLVELLDNGRAVRISEDPPVLKFLKIQSAIADLQTVRESLEPISSLGLLFGSRARGEARTDSDYDLYIVTDQEADARRLLDGTPLARRIEAVIWSSMDHRKMQTKDAGLAKKLAQSIVLWESRL